MAETRNGTICEDSILAERQNSTMETNQNFQLDPQSEGDSQALQSQQLLSANEILNKIQSLRVVLEKDLLACDAKWTLFVSTALSYRYEYKLVPFPPRFTNEETGCNIDALVSVINETPKLSVILQNIIEGNVEDMDMGVIDLLHWILITQKNPSLRLVEGEEVKSLLQIVDEKNMTCAPNHVFELTASKGFHSEADFRRRINDLPVQVAYMGQHLDSYYSILHNGFAKNKNDHHVILSTDLLTSLRNSPCGAAWGASQCGSLISCTALCEFAYDSNVDKITENSRGRSCMDIELDDPGKVRIRYLLFYGSRLPRGHKSSKAGLAAWISYHKYSLSFVTYLILLTSIVVANIDNDHSIKAFVGTKIQNALGICKKMLWPK